MNGYELGILDGIQANFASDGMNAAMVALTSLLDYEIFWIAVIVILLVIRRTRMIGLAVAIAFGLELVITQLCIKELIARPRPYVVAGYDILINPPFGFSFPSGHTGAAFAFASAMFFQGRKQHNFLWVPFLILAVIVAFSRLYLYVHYPSDVLAGMAFGILFGWLGSLIATKIKAHLDAKHA